MTDDMEELLQRFRPAGPPAVLRVRVLGCDIPEFSFRRRWAVWIFRGALTPLLLISFVLFHTTDRLNQDTASRIGSGPMRWTAEAQQAADLIGSDPAGHQYIVLNFLDGSDRVAPKSRRQGENQ